MNRKHFLIATLVSVVLLTVVFIPLSGQQDGSYDPWKDLNDDGIIDVYDLQELAFIYGTSGEPINKTAFLLEMRNHLFPEAASSFNVNTTEKFDVIRTIGQNFSQEFVVKSTADDVTCTFYHDNKATSYPPIISAFWIQNPTSLDNINDEDETTSSQAGRSSQTTDDTTYIQLDLGEVCSLELVWSYIGIRCGNDMGWGNDFKQDMYAFKDVSARWIRITAYLSTPDTAVYKLKYSEKGWPWFTLATKTRDVPYPGFPNPWVEIIISEVECFDDETINSLSAHVPVSLYGNFYPSYKFGGMVSTGAATMKYVWFHAPEP